ncbi:hypothetical protein MPTK1_1g25010 [Marchantia polymorpha subsp. ruderalis]|uniref:Uncharacterized protein n=2 Tax=Marchantia polymorpha TaxID=3197 RepID=A0AAF6AU19_MARPO|nr:hypothetical protein MARPO_0061s0024 [Marchantia polymorpha]BBM99939.1 hypothetical protein Mp_1g25010 [Marchantia polymorpha subsp. ruderalis]|eukprot:PTQ36747.1 hypothetical protein MARPO_0061s0024 [Marchantia polymorpha]
MAFEDTSGHISSNLVRTQLGQNEVRHLRIQVLVQQDVAAFEVPMTMGPANQFLQVLETTSLVPQSSNGGIPDEPVDTGSMNCKHQMLNFPLALSISWTSAVG